MRSLSVITALACIGVMLAVLSDRADRLSGKVYTCQSGDGFWTEKKWSCTKEEFDAHQRAASKGGGNG